MIRLLLGCLFAALCSTSCVLDGGEESPDQIAFRLDPVLLGLTRVEIFRLDAQGKPIAPALFDDSLRALSDASGLDARGYGGGQAAFSIKGYKGIEVVYEIKVTANGNAPAAVQEIKLIPLYAITVKIADTVDQDRDGYKSGYRLITDVNTNLARESIQLKYFWKKEGALVWESRGEGGRFAITKLSADDAASQPMIGGPKTAGTLKIEAYNGDNLLVAEKTLEIREETGDQDDPGFEFRIINHTGAFLQASLTVAGQVEGRHLAPRETLLVEKPTRPDRVHYYAVADGDVVVWEDTVIMVDHSSYEATLVLENNTEEFFVLTVTNNSATAVDRVIVDQGLAGESFLEGPIPGDGVSYNAGAHNYSPTATVTFRNEAAGKTATVYPLQFDIHPVYGYRYASVALSNSNWSEPSLNLPGKSWKLIASAIEPAMADSAGNAFTDVFARMQGCARDGILAFKADGTFTDNEGPTKCAEANPQSIRGTWSVNADRSQLTMKWETDTNPMVFKVEAMTPTTLRLSNDKDAWDDGKVHELSMTFSAL